MIFLGERLSDITLFMGKAFSHRTKKYNMLVMRNLWSYLNIIVMKMHGLFSLTVRMVFKFLIKIFCGRGVHNYIVHKIIYIIVKLHVHDDSIYCNANSGIYFHNPFKYLLNFLAVRLGTCWTVTKYIPCGMVINNGVTFTKITSTTRVTNLYNFKNSLGTET